jgi:hypothetical protein
LRRTRRRARTQVAQAEIRGSIVLTRKQFLLRT